MKYRHKFKHNIIEAEQYTNRDQILNLHPTSRIAKLGDYIITDVLGRRKAVWVDQFEAEYDKVTGIKKVWEIWTPGYHCTGEHAEARPIEGVEIEAEFADEALDIYCSYGQGLADEKEYGKHRNWEGLCVAILKFPQPEHIK